LVLVALIVQTEQILYFQVLHRLVEGLAVKIVARVRETVSLVGLAVVALLAAV
jgi:hypothetical protein